MEQSALKVTETQLETPTCVASPPIQAESEVSYSYASAAPVVHDPQRLERLRKRRRKLALFIKMETIALFFLALALTGATSEVIREAGFRSAFKLALFPAALTVALIPVIFFGLTRQEYRYRARRSR
jgi:hypothetical protein